MVGLSPAAPHRTRRFPLRRRASAVLLCTVLAACAPRLYAQTSDADVARVSIVVSGDAYRSTTTGVWFEEGKLVVDPTKTPCHLDGHYGGNVRRAIYVRAGEYLTLCVGPSTEDGARPTDFVTAPGRDSVSLYVYKIKR